MSKPWGGIGAWALEAERAEAEERERSAFLAGDPLQSFPSLREAASKPKKKKGVSLTLSEFTTGTYVGHGGALREPIPEEMLRLPTGPRERSSDELEHSSLGGGFRSYGYGGGAPPRRLNEESFRTSDRDFGSLGSSKADEVDNWSSGKKFVARTSRNSGFGSGFRDDFGSGVRSDRWGRGSGAFPSNGERERRRLVLDPPTRDSESQQEHARSRPSPFSAARPREEVLAEKGLDWRKMGIEIEMKKNGGFSSSCSSRPSSAQSSRPGSSCSQASDEGGVPKLRPKVNPFGDAKPREVLLEEKGMDWRMIDQELEHRRIDRHDRPETDEEKMPKEEIDHLKKEFGKETEGNMNGDSLHHPTEQCDSLLEQNRKREKELEHLIRELDDKARFGQKAFADTRPGSGSGRAFSTDKPSLQTSFSKDSRQTEFAERPRSRGTVDSWGRPMIEKRRFQSSRDSVFLASRNMDRLKSGERW